MSRIWTPDRQIIAPSRRVWTPPSKQRGFVCLPGGGLGAGRPSGGAGGASDPDFDKVSLLLHFDGSSGSTSFVDSSQNNFGITPVGNAQISTSQSRFGGASGFFDGSGDRINTPSSDAFNFGTGDFFVECWRYLLGHGGDGYSHYFSINTQSVFAFKSWSSQTYLVANGAVRIGDGTNPVLNTWECISVGRIGSNLLIFNGGVLKNTVAIDPGMTFGSSAGGAYIGQAFETVSEGLNGYLDELRVTKGLCRHTSSYTPDVAAFPNS